MGGSSSTPTAASTKFVIDTVQQHDVVIFSKTTCPYCTAAKDALKSVGAKALVIELDRREDGKDIQASLAEQTGRSTVPNVFVKGKSIGGGDETSAMARSGKLKSLIFD